MSNALFRPATWEERYVTENNVQIFVDRKTLHVNFIYKKDDLLGTNSIKYPEKYGRHGTCDKPLTCADGIVICEECKEVLMF